MVETVQGRKSVNLVFVWIAALLAMLLLTIGYGADFIIPMAHDGYHDARHAAGFACH